MNTVICVVYSVSIITVYYGCMLTSERTLSL